MNLGIYAKSFEGEENSFLISSSTALDKKITDTDGDGIFEITDPHHSQKIIFKISSSKMYKLSTKHISSV